MKSGAEHGRMCPWLLDVFEKLCYTPDIVQYEPIIVLMIDITISSQGQERTGQKEVSHLTQSFSRVRFAASHRFAHVFVINGAL